jgi:uncharacterized membrane protein (DUF106 family)
MNRSKCNKCGLINSSSDTNCRRCGVNLYSAENASPKYNPVAQTNDFQPSSSSSNPFLYIVVIGVLLFVGIYVYTTYINDQVKEEEDSRRAKEAKRERDWQMDAANRPSREEMLQRELERQRQDQSEKASQLYRR